MEVLHVLYQIDRGVAGQQREREREREILIQSQCLLDNAAAKRPAGRPCREAAHRTNVPRSGPPGDLAAKRPAAQMLVFSKSLAVLRTPIFSKVRFARGCFAAVVDLIS
jgi:hypothetical protein